MNALWAYFWPPFAVGLLAGGLAGTIAFRRKSRRNLSLAIGVVAALATAAFWHGPLGAADRLVRRVELSARHTLDYYEMSEIKAHLHHGPLTRRLILSGRADDFQTSELARIMSQIPGVSSARWTKDNPGPPLIAEGEAVAVLGFLFGLLLAYLFELRRRYNAQWNW